MIPISIFGYLRSSLFLEAKTKPVKKKIESLNALDKSLWVFSAFILVENKLLIYTKIIPKLAVR